MGTERISAVKSASIQFRGDIREFTPLPGFYLVIYEAFVEGKLEAPKLLDSHSA
jgi:hypothetical protein